MRRASRQLRLAFCHGGHGLPHADAFGQKLFERLSELRFIVKQIDLTRRAGHEQKNDVLRSRRATTGRLSHAVLRQQRSQCGDSQTHT